MSEYLACGLCEDRRKYSLTMAAWCDRYDCQLAMSGQVSTVMID